MQISKEEIIKIGKLANLSLSEEEINNYTTDMQNILDFANVVNNVDTSKTQETIGANEAYNVFRKDEIEKFESREKLLQNAPEEEDGMFKIPKVIQ